jgi:hypothetical protein
MMEFVSWDDEIPIYGKITKMYRNVWNHQPDMYNSTYAFLIISRSSRENRHQNSTRLNNLAISGRLLGDVSRRRAGCFAGFSRRQTLVSAMGKA